MENLISQVVLDEVLNCKLRKSSKFQKCSYLTPTGKYVIIKEHYEVHKLMVAEMLVSCPSDAEQILSDLGYIRYSWIGYLTLANKEPTPEQYKELEKIFMEINKYRDEVCIQIQNEPKFYTNYQLNDIPKIIEDIKRFYIWGSDYLQHNGFTNS